MGVALPDKDKIPRDASYEPYTGGESEKVRKSPVASKFVMEILAPVNNALS